MNLREPISVEDAKQWLGIRQSDGQEDESLGILIPAVRASVEAYLPEWIASRDVLAEYPARTYIPARGLVTEIYEAEASTGDGWTDATAWPSGKGIGVDVPPGACELSLHFHVECQCSEIVRHGLLVALKNAYENRTGGIITAEVLDIIRPETEVNV